MEASISYSIWYTKSVMGKKNNASSSGGGWRSDWWRHALSNSAKGVMNDALTAYSLLSAD